MNKQITARRESKIDSKWKPDEAPNSPILKKKLHRKEMKAVKVVISSLSPQKDDEIQRYIEH